MTDQQLAEAEQQACTDLNVAKAMRELQVASFFKAITRLVNLGRKVLQQKAEDEGLLPTVSQTSKVSIK